MPDTTLRIEPEGLLSTDYEIRRGDGLFARVDMARMRSAGRIETHSATYEIRPERLLSGNYVMEHDGARIARAERAGWLRPRYAIRGPDRVLTLRPAGLLARRYDVIHGDHAIGSIARQGLFNRAATADFDENVPEEMQLFLVFLALLRWRRQRQASRG